MEKEKIERVNLLSAKQRSEGLSPEEKKEQAALRQEYLSSIRENLRGTLEGISNKPKH